MCWWQGAEVDSIVPDDADPICRALGRIAKLLRGRLGYLDFDYALIKALAKKTYDLIYVPSGRVIFIQLLKILEDRAYAAHLLGVRTGSAISGVQVN